MAKKKSETGDAAKSKETKPKVSAKSVASKPAAEAKSAGGESKSAKKPAAKKEPAKNAPATLGTPMGMPMVDTSLAAQSAANMLLMRNKIAQEPMKQTGSLIDQIKQDMNKSHGSTISGVLDSNSPGAKRPNLPSSGPQNQRGHNQTFGADVNRINVPRRTGG